MCILEARILHIISHFVFKSNLFCCITIIKGFQKCAICTISKKQMSDVKKQTYACIAVFSNIMISPRYVEAEKKGKILHGTVPIKIWQFLSV
jgi:formate hydrogenlyase subunit 3/multisubunit Na+/H+ antiporter MnhD subunit